MIYIIVAADEQNGIGKNGNLPWRLKQEMRHFTSTTLKTDDPHKQNMLVMGLGTWNSLPVANRPLKNRRNIVLSTKPDFKLPEAETAGSIEEALSMADSGIENIFICGGGKVFEAFINRPDLDGIYFTRIHKNFDCDTFFPKIPTQFSKVTDLGQTTEDGIICDFLLYERS